MFTLIFYVAMIVMVPMILVEKRKQTEELKKLVQSVQAIETKLHEKAELK